MWWCTSSGKIELNITKAQAARGSHPGDCEDSVRELMKEPSIARQLKKINDEALATEISEYSDWETEDHELNLVRLVWIACGDLQDGR